jgi:FkbH-like protein
MMPDELTCEQKDSPGEKRAIKCVIWDLDNTLWHGVLLEDQHISLRPEVLEVVKELDRRGILNSIASKNDHDIAMATLQQLGISEYFLYPQIHWHSKVKSVQDIAASLNVALDALAFVDDQPAERAEVAFFLPQVLCIDSADVHTMLHMPEMNPRFITRDARRRRQMYLDDIKRAKDEKDFIGSQEAFLATLNMVFTISAASVEDLQRAEELTLRTHQLNTTGRTFSYEELDMFRLSPSHKLLVAGLDDKYGSYGKIGLALLECDERVWTIKLLLMSCRVMSRGVGMVMISYIAQMARKAHVRLLAEFVPNGRNRMMYITYKFAGFKEIRKADNFVVLENDMIHTQPFPEYVTMIADES